MRTADPLEKHRMLGKTEGRRRRWQRIRWLDGITNSMDVNLSKLSGIVKNREVWRAAGGVVAKSQTRFSDWTTNMYMCVVVVYSPSHVWLLAIQQTVARQAPLMVGFSKQEYWSGLPFPSPIYTFMYFLLQYICIPFFNHIFRQFERKNPYKTLTSNYLNCPCFSLLGLTRLWGGIAHLTWHFSCVSVPQFPLCYKDNNRIRVSAHLTPAAPHHNFSNHTHSDPFWGSGS